MGSGATSDVEHVAGTDIEVTFDTGLCIHSRFCVLQAPDVFKANTPGDWILPDAMNATALAAVARNCPSGAISYGAKDPTTRSAGEHGPVARERTLCGQRAYRPP